MTTTGPAAVVKFDENAYRELIHFIEGFKSTLDFEFLRSVPDMTLDDSLGDDVKPGSPNWKRASKIQERAGAFGGSVSTHFTQLSHNCGDLGDMLVEGLGIFKNCSDLAAIDASTLIDQFPDFGSSGA
jgi:hypothetical protein